MNKIIRREADFSDLTQELKRRGILRPYWTTKDGRQIPIEDLTDEHLLNIVRMLIDKEQPDEMPTGDPEWYKN